MGIFEKFVRAYRVHDTQTYRETIACVEKVASVSLGSLAGKSEEEKTQLIRRITDLSGKLNGPEAICISVRIRVRLCVTRTEE
jgi:hypothetical protein